MTVSLTTADWLAILGLLVGAGVPLLGFFAALLTYAAKSLQYLGGIQKTLDNLENWMKAFGEDHAELKERMILQGGRIDRHDQLLDEHGRRLDAHGKLIGVFHADDP